MARPECRMAGYKLLGDYVFSEIIPEMLNDGRWDLVSSSVGAAKSALHLSREEGFISNEQFQALEADLNALESATNKKDEKATGQAYSTFFTNYGTTIIDAIAECECRGGESS